MINKNIKIDELDKIKELLDTMQIEFKNDKDFYTIKAYDTTPYDRAKAKKEAEKLRREYERWVIKKKRRELN